MNKTKALRSPQAPAIIVQDADGFLLSPAAFIEKNGIGSVSLQEYVGFLHEEYYNIAKTTRALAEMLDTLVVSLKVATDQPIFLTERGTVQ
jgi:hypothetical protein